MGKPWYPGHMAAALRAVRENAKLVDVVVEVADARGPIVSRDPTLSRMIGNRPRVIALAKADLADPAVTELWVSHFGSQGVRAFPVNACSGDGVAALLRGCRESVAGGVERLSRGGRRRALRVMVAGVPNVGKSSLINRMTSSSAARAGATPGITRGKQWIRSGEGIEVLDLPGILRHRDESPEDRMKLALLGVIPETTYDPHEVALFAIGLVSSRFPDMARALGVDGPGAEPEEAIAELGRKKGFIAKGGLVDCEKAALWLIRQLRDGRAGRFSLESPS